MARRRKAEKREIKEDPLYQSALVARFVNLVMERGKKSVAQRIIYEALEKISEKLEKGNPVDLLMAALDNARPKLEVKSRRVGGATYQVPMEVPFERQISLAIRWLMNAANARKGLAMADALAQEIVDAYNNIGVVIKKRDEVHKMAQASRVFAHFRW